jgi:hypothetical protein
MECCRLLVLALLSTAAFACSNVPTPFVPESNDDGPKWWVGPHGS